MRSTAFTSVVSPLRRLNFSEAPKEDRGRTARSSGVSVDAWRSKALQENASALDGPEGHFTNRCLISAVYVH